MTDKKVTFASTNSYSQALYELGNEAGSLSEIEDQALAILKLVSENEEVKNFIKNPTNKIEQQAAAFDLISEKLNSDTKSQTQMKEILAGKNFYQANLDDAKWKKGTVYFRLVNTGSIELKIIGSKAALNNIDAKQGTINYEIKYP